MTAVARSFSDVPNRSFQFVVPLGFISRTKASVPPSPLGDRPRTPLTAVIETASAASSAVVPNCAVKAFEVEWADIARLGVAATPTKATSDMTTRQVRIDVLFGNPRDSLKED